MRSPVLPAFRSAVAADLPTLVAMLGDDELGRSRNPALADAPDAYRAAMAELVDDPDNYVLVMTEADVVVAIAQLTFIRGLSYAGGLRAQIESVRVARALRGQGRGTALMREALRRAAVRGCVLVQLTTDHRRPDTRRFYERLGFVASHHGLKLRLDG